MLFAGLPDAMFIPAGSPPLQNLALLCRVTEIYPGGTAQQSDFSMMDTAAPSTATVISGTGAITLFPYSQAQAAPAGPWNENVTPPLTLSGTVSPGPGQLDAQVARSDRAVMPGPGSLFLALGVVATFAAFRLHEGLRG